MIRIWELKMRTKRIAASLLLLLSTSAHAMESAFIVDEKHQQAAIEIQRFYRDTKLSHLFDSLNPEKDLNNFSEENIRALNQQSDIKSIIIGAMFCLRCQGELSSLTASGESEAITHYKTYIDTQTQIADPIKRQLSFFIKTFFISDNESKLEVLNDILSSPYPFFRWQSYEGLSRACEESGDMERAASYLRKSFDLPRRYHAQVFEALANLYDQTKRKDYLNESKRHFCFQQVIKMGSLKQKIKASDELAGLYRRHGSVLLNPAKALECYEWIYSDNKLSSVNEELGYIKSNFANFLAYAPEGIKDEDRAIRILEEIISNEEACSDYDYNYAGAISNLIDLYRHKNPERALDLAQKALSNPKLSEKAKTNAEKALSRLYQYGDVSVQNHQQALQILEKHAANSSDNNERLDSLFQLAQCLQHGSTEVRDITRAIQYYEEVRRGNNYLKLSSLYNLSYLYGHDLAHRNQVKEMECLEELAGLQVETPLEQVKSFVRLLSLYTCNSETLSPEKARALVQRILNHPAVDATARLDVQATLSVFYHRHPEHATQEEIIQLNEELAHNPMATPPQINDAHTRLIAIYTEQQNLPQVIASYEHWLTRATQWQRNDITNRYIVFLQNPEYAAAHNHARLAELQATLHQPLPQVITTMTADVHHVPGVVAGFGGAGHVDPFFSPEMIRNRKLSLLALSGDPFDQINFTTNLQKTIAEIKHAITEYGARDTDCHATSVLSREVFETGNAHPGSYRSICNDLDYSFSYDEYGAAMTYGQALVRMWTRMTSHPKSNGIKDLFIVQLAAAIDPDGHIVCPPGKMSRHHQAMESYFPDIRAATLSLKDIFSFFAKQEQETFDALPETDSVKILKAKVESITWDEIGGGESKVDDSHVLTWASPEYAVKIALLSHDEQILLNNYFEQMVTRFEENLLLSRDILSEEEHAFARKEIASYLNADWFM